MSFFTIATFNVNSIRSRLHILERWLQKNPVNVLCLQETKVTDDQFPVGAFDSWGYNVFFRGRKAYAGVAIACQDEPSEVIYGFPDGHDGKDDDRLIMARFDDLWVINTYVPQGKSIDHPDYQYKKNFFRRFLDMLESGFKDDDKILWVGDMNVAPEDKDVTNPETKRNHVCFHEEIRDLFDTVKSWGFVDVFRKHHPEEGQFTFWDYRVKNALERNIGWRVDHILATNPVAERSVDCYIDREPRGWERPSDHTFLVGIFDIQ
ncbi:exodeoxyribonuclease-3 [Acetomicrobium flavidum]|uniref:Exodeoxyribonuclease-3 n=1 Tax=Acetomicrobium flavidum TaxID=49896 RepID=A0ABY1JDR1_9BACT|nr:exodeoxyribonuclease-3 [Acetomicrobium flavidum]